jgi:hypothetical protein
MKKKKVNEPLSEFTMILDGKYAGQYINKEGRRYTKSQLKERRPDLFTK